MESRVIIDPNQIYSSNPFMTNLLQSKFSDLYLTLTQHVHIPKITSYLIQFRKIYTETDMRVRSE